MLIIPLIDIYASGLDWLLEGASAPKGLLFFFAVLATKFLLILNQDRPSSNIHPSPIKDHWQQNSMNFEMHLRRRKPEMHLRR